MWASIFAFVLGYLAWQVVEVQLARKFRQTRKSTNRMLCDLPPFATGLLKSAASVRFSNRCKDRQIVCIGVPSAVIFVPGNEDADGVHILGLDMGYRCVPVHSQRFNCGLQFPAPRDLHPRKVRSRSLCYFQGPNRAFDCWSSSLTSVLSINAAISASVVLASRLPDDISVFALMLYAVVLFAMFPVLRHRLQVRPLFKSPISFGYHKRGKHHIDPLYRANCGPLRLWTFVHGGRDKERTSLTCWFHRWGQ